MDSLNNSGEALSSYLSDSEHRILEFYRRFDSYQQLSAFFTRTERFSGEIKMLPGDNQHITIVCPVTDSGNEQSKKIRSVFNGMGIVYVESGRDNPHFNYSTSCNTGLEYAVKNTESEWIVLSNDDMFQIDPPSSLVKVLSGMDSKDIDVILTGYPSLYHSYDSDILARRGPLSSVFRPIINRIDPFQEIMERFSVQYIPTWKGSNGIKERISHAFLNKKLGKIINVGSFCIFSKAFLNAMKFRVFDQNYWNGVEDIDLSIRIRKEKARVGFIDYRIGDMVGVTLGRGKSRYLRNIYNYAYFSHKFSVEDIKFATGI